MSIARITMMELVDENSMDTVEELYESIREEYFPNLEQIINVRTGPSSAISIARAFFNAFLGNTLTLSLCVSSKNAILDIFIGFSFLNAQCTVNDATDCECEDPTQVDCDLLPDIQVSWFGLIDVSDGPTEYPQEGAGENNGRLRISESYGHWANASVGTRGLIVRVYFGSFAISKS